MDSFGSIVRSTGLLAVLAVAASFWPSESSAGPSAETAKKCLRYAYIAFPYRRPGSVPMSGDRQNYFKECMAKEGDVPQPAPPPKS
jgi:hypothetical protein